MAEWIEANTTLKRRQFNYNRYPFQRAIADDMHPSMYVKKISQIGLTEISIRKFLAMLTRNTALKGIYTLPTEAMFKKIYSSRMKPILATDSNFNPPGEKPVRHPPIIPTRKSLRLIVGTTQGKA